MTLYDPVIQHLGLILLVLGIGLLAAGACLFIRFVRKTNWL